MYMTWHNTPAVNFKAFTLSAIVKAVNKNLAVLISGENIYPVYGGKAYKVQAFFIIELVLSAHAAKVDCKVFNM